MSALTVAALLGVGACSDDEPEVISQGDYEANAQQLCDRQADGTFLSLADFKITARSDAEQVALLRAEFVPRVRAIVRGINSGGYPAEHRTEYVGALNQVMTAAQEIEDDTYELIDRQRRGALPDDENPFVTIDQGFATADVPC